MRRKVVIVLKSIETTVSKASAWCDTDQESAGRQQFALRRKNFNEGRWTKDKNYMAGLPAGAPGCMQWNAINLNHAEMIHSFLESLLDSADVHAL